MVNLAYSSRVAFRLSSHEEPYLAIWPTLTPTVSIRSNYHPITQTPSASRMYLRCTLSHLYAFTQLHSLNIRQETRKRPHIDLADSEIYAVTGASWVVSIVCSHTLIHTSAGIGWESTSVLSILIPLSWFHLYSNSMVRQDVLMWEFQESFALLTRLLDNTGLFPHRWFQSTSKSRRHLCQVIQHACPSGAIELADKVVHRYRRVCKDTFLFHEELIAS